MLLVSYWCALVPLGSPGTQVHRFSDEELCVHTTVVHEPWSATVQQAVVVDTLLHVTDLLRAMFLKIITFTLQRNYSVLVVRAYTLNELPFWQEKPRSQRSSLPPPGTCVRFYRARHDKVH